MSTLRKPQSTAEASPRDYGFIAIVTLAIGVAFWLLFMPWVSVIASSTMNRFHLRTPSFVRWAMQFPIPSMYNCANEYKVQGFPPGFADPIIDDNWRYINHFPARIITFADARYRHLSRKEDRWFTLRSSYRGQTIQSTIHLQSLGQNGEFLLIRLESTED